MRSIPSGDRQRSSGFAIAAALAAALLMLLAGCVSGPPVQEMSDARQAIGVARDAGAEQTAAADLHAAEAYLDSAQRKLGERSYSQARRDALLAKDKALEALAGAEAAGQNQPR
jgi:hypothetical protein